MSSVDLHLHSHYSDGTWSPSKLVQFAIGQKLSLISLTDHDSLAGLFEARQACADLIDLIDGVEISVKFGKQNFHLLAYNVQLGSERLNQLLEHNQCVRLSFAEELLERLSEDGIKVEIADLLSIAGPGGIGKAHLTKGIIESGVKGDITTVYNRYFGRDRDSRYRIERPWVDVFQALEVVKQVGGISVLAHPGFEEMKTGQLLLELKKHGLDGVEVYHGFHDSLTRENLMRIANSLDLVVTGGSDCHGPYEGGAPYIGSQNLTKEMLSGFIDLLKK